MTARSQPTITEMSPYKYRLIDAFPLGVPRIGNAVIENLIKISSPQTGPILCAAVELRLYTFVVSAIFYGPRLLNDESKLLLLWSEWQCCWLCNGFMTLKF